MINTDVLPVPRDGDYVGQKQFIGKSKQIGHSRVLLMHNWLRSGAPQKHIIGLMNVT